MNKTVSNLILTKNTKLNHDSYLLILKSDKSISTIKPGQFVNVHIKDEPSTFLRRPFSIHEVDYTTNSISILVKAVGNGTKKLIQSTIGDNIDVVFPLGNGFTMANKGEKVLLIGGGVGIAPMMYFGRILNENDIDVHILLGARSESDQILINDFKQYGTVHLTTNDGSIGIKGFVTDHPVFDKNEGFKRIYCCGPEPMMRAVSNKATQLNIDCEVSLENMMACGIGVCLCCVTKTNEGNKCVCSEGPVFNINNLKW